MAVDAGEVVGVAVAYFKGELADGHFGVAFQEFFGSVNSNFAKDFSKARLVFFLKIMG